MPTFRLTIRLLDAAYHGRTDGGEPEWPPSPLRAFQALVNAAAGHWRPRQLEAYAGPALEWLESLPHPTIVAPVGRMATFPHRLYVPNNAGDLMVAAWARGNRDADMSEHRTEKDVRPTRFAEGQAIHFDWPLTAEQFEHGKTHEGTLKAAARSITHLGWGVDQAVGHAELLAAEPPTDSSAERWLPADGDTPLRVPQAGTLADLRRKHNDFLGRLDKAGFKPVPPLTAFRVVGYRRAAEPAGRPWAAFEIRHPDTDVGGRASFDTPRRAREVAAWVRHAVAEVCQGWPAEYGTIEQFVHGHDGPDRPIKGAGADRRFQYLPLPSIEHRPTGAVVGAIRRALVTAPPGCEPQIEWLKQRLSGQELKADDTVFGLLNRLSDGDWVRSQYTRPAKTWSTVTPVLLPGHDNRGRTDRLLWKAFEDAGLAPEALTHAEVEWRTAGFRAGVDPAWRFIPPIELEPWPRYHVRVRFARPLPGPLAIGSGRYRGFGLFAADEG